MVLDGRKKHFVGAVPAFGTCRLRDKVRVIYGACEKETALRMVYMEMELSSSYPIEWRRYGVAFSSSSERRRENPFTPLFSRVNSLHLRPIYINRRRFVPAAPPGNLLAGIMSSSI